MVEKNLSQIDDFRSSQREHVNESITRVREVRYQNEYHENLVITIKVNGRLVNAFIDTAAQVNLVSKEFANFFATPLPSKESVALTCAMKGQNMRGY